MLHPSTRSRTNWTDIGKIWAFKASASQLIILQVQVQVKRTGVRWNPTYLGKSWSWDIIDLSVFDDNQPSTKSLFHLINCVPLFISIAEVHRLLNCAKWKGDGCMTWLLQKLINQLWPISNQVNLHIDLFSQPSSSSEAVSRAFVIRSCYMLFSNLLVVQIVISYKLPTGTFSIWILHACCGNNISLLDSCLISVLCYTCSR